MFVFKLFLVVQKYCFFLLSLSNNKHRNVTVEIYFDETASAITSTDDVMSEVKKLTDVLHDAHKKYVFKFVFQLSFHKIETKILNFYQTLVFCYCFTVTMFLFSSLSFNWRYQM